LVAILAGGAIFGLMVKPQMDRLAKAQKTYKDLEPQGSEQAYQAAEKALKAAKAEVKAKEAKWARYAVKMPKVDMKPDPYRGMWLYWKECNQILAPLMAQFIEKLPVRVSGQIQVPGGPVDPSQVPEMVVLPLGQWQGRGKLSQILSLFSAWEKAPRVVLIDNMDLVAESPNVTDDLMVSFSATLYMFIKNAGGAGAAGAAPGGGMMPGGAGAPGGVTGGMMGPGGGPMGGMMGKGPGMGAGGGMMGKAPGAGGG